jgi:uncharacterized protein (DUF885 family)
MCLAIWGLGCSAGWAQTSPAAGQQIEQMIREYVADVECVKHRYPVPLDEHSQQIHRELIETWLARLGSVPFSSLNRSDQVDYRLFKNKLSYLQDKNKLETQRDQQAAAQFLPFHAAMVEFCRHRENVDPIHPASVAHRLHETAVSIEAVTAQLGDQQSPTQERRLAALRATELLSTLRAAFTEADQFYQGYDPEYTWWCKKPVERLKTALDEYHRMLKEKVVGIPESDTETIIGLPIGADGIALELRHEWIAHSPEELIALAEREMQWCDQQIRQAADEMGCEGDWKRALEVVKGRHVQPGEQPAMIRRLALEAIQFLRDRQLLTIPELAANGWRMTMMTPERQRISPYFLGGDTIMVSFPTDSMTHDEKLMSMRSNNEHFARATVQHELIPGHAMQAYMLPRYKPYRNLFETAFWIEGWALHWEMLLWDLGFARGPEDKIGMLFWRRHRCARIIFSLSYHLGKMSPEQCIDYLVDQVGHERAAATAEVRRSIMGNYGPMYQAAYMLGGIQLRSLHRDLVGTGKMTQMDFHDAVLKEHSIPIEPLRDYLMGTEMNSDTQSRWRFADSK